MVGGVILPKMYSVCDYFQFMMSSYSCFTVRIVCIGSPILEVHSWLEKDEYPPLFYCVLIKVCEDDGGVI